MNVRNLIEQFLGKLRPGDMQSLIDALICLVFSIMKSVGMTADEAKERWNAKVDEIEATPDLPMGDEPQ